MTTRLTLWALVAGIVGVARGQTAAVTPAPSVIRSTIYPAENDLQHWPSSTYVCALSLLKAAGQIADLSLQDYCEPITIIEVSISISIQIETEHHTKTKTI
jgi:hypothetical protein